MHRRQFVTAGAGLMLCAREALVRYQLPGMQLLTSSTVAMQTQLSPAIERRKWIVVTAWKPLGIWSRHALKPLADPAGVFGSGDRIDTLITPSLPQRAPRVVDFLRCFELPLGDIDAMMARLDDRVPPEQVTADRIDTHTDDIARWTRSA